MAEETDGSQASATPRDAGLALLRLTEKFDSPLGIKSGAGGVDMAVLAFGVRARRLLRSVYRLLDEGTPDTATPLLRVMAEYHIVGSWLKTVGDERMGGWSLNDIRERLTTLRSVLEAGKLVGEPRQMIEKEIASSEDALRQYGGPNVALTQRAARKAGEPATPSLQQMATDTGLDFLYAYVYRVQSQADAHATTLAIDASFENTEGDPGPRLRDAPRHALTGHDLYAVGAWLLADILSSVVQRFPELGWDAELTSIIDELHALPPAAPPEE